MLDFGSRSTLEAAEAALALVTSEFFLPAISFTSFPVDRPPDSSYKILRQRRVSGQKYELLWQLNIPYDIVVIINLIS